MKKIIMKIHGVIGLFVGLVLIIVGLSGCVYSFQYEIRNVLYPDLIHVDVPRDASKLSADSIEAIAASYYSESKIREMVINHNPQKSTKVYMLDHHLLYINPYSGEVLGVKNTRKDPFLMAWSLHTQLGLGKAGGKIVGWATFALIPLIITGIWLWWPVVYRSWRGAFRLPFRGNWKRLNFQWHKNGGFYASLLLLFICLSGLMMSFKWFEDGVYAVSGSSSAHRIIPKAVEVSKQEGAVQKAISYTIDKFPEHKELNVFYPGSPDGVFMFIVKYQDRLGRREILYFNPDDGELLQGNYAADHNVGDKIKAMNYNIHSGQIGGLPGRIVAFLTTLFMVYLVCSGAIIWFQRKFRFKSHYSNPK